MEALEQFLGSGHKVIISLNAEMIWHQPIESKDKNGNPRSDHAVVVTGVDTANGVVHLNDSGTPKGRDEQIPMELFVNAWATSHNFMVVTTRNRPLRYQSRRRADTVQTHPSAARRTRVSMNPKLIRNGYQ